MILFGAILAGITLWFDYSPDIRQFIIINGLLTIGVYVISIEVPGFLLLSAYDETSVKLLKDIKTNLIQSIYSFNTGIQGIQGLLESNRGLLQEIGTYDQINYYVESSVEINHANKSVFDLLLMTVNQAIKDCDDQSKHPFPKLVDILSLAGLSFLIAQLLK